MHTIPIKRFDLERTDKILLLVAGILFAVSNYGLFVLGGKLSLNHDGVELGTITTKGKVKRRHAKSLYWETFSGHSKIYLRDIVYTPKSSVAEFRWGKDQTLRLEPDSMVQFDEITLDRIEIQLIEGKVKTDTATSPGVVVRKKESAVRIVPYPKTRKLLQKSFRLDDFKTSLRTLDEKLNALLSKGSNIEPTKSVSVARVEPLRFADYQMKLIGPVHKEFNVSRNKWVKMQWARLPVDGVTYQLEISREKTFQRFVSHKTERDSLSIQFEDTGKYYWRVQASDGNKTLISKISDFTMSWGETASEINERSQAREMTSTARIFAYEISASSTFDVVLKRGESKRNVCELTGLKLGSYFCRVIDRKTGKIVREFGVRVP